MRIFAFIGAMLRAAFSMLRRALALPGRVMGALLGVPAFVADIPPPAPPEDLEAAEPSFDRQRLYDQTASMVLAWCADSVIGSRPAPLPPGLPIRVRNWLPGLTREECMCVVNADRSAISAHIRGICDIEGVRGLGPLPAPGDWPAQPRKEPADADVTYTAAGPFRP
jgi:hypothetical protein